MSMDVRIAKMSDILLGRPDYRGRSYAEIRSGMLYETAQTVFDGFDMYGRFLGIKRLAAVAEPMQSGKRLPTAYRNKVSPMFAQYAASRKDMLNTDDFVRSAARSVKAVEEYLERFERSKSTDPVLLWRLRDYPDMEARLGRIRESYNQAIGMLERFRDTKLDLEPTESEFREISSVFCQIFETVYREIEDFLSLYLGVFDGHDRRVHALLERVMAVDKTVISSSTKSDVRTVRNSLAHSMFERKENGYRIHDDAGMYSKVFTVRTLYDFSVKAVEKTALAMDIVLIMTSMTLYHLLTVTYTGGKG